MSVRPPKPFHALQGLADKVAAAFTARLAITTLEGALILVTPGATESTLTSPLPQYDPVNHRLVWASKVALIDYGSAPLRLPDGQVYLLWAAGVWGELDLPMLARLFCQQLSLLHKHQQEVDNLAEQLLETYEEVNLFYRLADAFAIATDESQLFDILLTRALQATSGHSGAVILLDSQGTPEVVAARGELSAFLSGYPLAPFPALETALRHGVTRNLGGQSEVAPEQPDRPTIIVPVLVKRDPVGAVVLQKRTRAPFGAGEVKVVRSLSTHAGVFLNNLRQSQRLIEAAHLQHQLELAETIQHQLLPASELTIAGMDIAAAYRASKQVSGDYYDVFDIAAHHVGAVIADVSGHSLASALLMTAARSAMRLLMRHASHPAEVLRQLNETLYADLDQTDLFLSLCLVIVDRKTHTLRYASAGHNPGLLYRQDVGDTVSLDATGFVIGFAPDACFEEYAWPFRPGDALVLYTDGVVEARSPQGAFFGEDRLHRRVQSEGDAEARLIVQSIMTDVCRHAHNHLVDDTTLLVLKLADHE